MDLQVLIIYHEDLNLTYGSPVKLQSAKGWQHCKNKKTRQKVISKKTRHVEKYLCSSSFVPSPSKAGSAIKVLLYHL